MKNYIKGLFAYSWFHTLRYLRDPGTLFWVLFLPLGLLLVLGTVFGGDSGVSFKTAVFNNSDTVIASELETQLKESVQVIEVDERPANMQDALEMMGRGELASIIELPQTFGTPNEQGIPTGNVIVYYEQASPEGGQTVASIMKTFLESINVQLTGVSPPLGVEPAPTTTDNLTMIHYLYPSLTGLTLIMTGIFMLMYAIPAEKKAGTLRRIHATPFKPSQLLLGTTITYLIVSLLAITIMTIAALVVFDLEMRGSYITVGILAILGSLLMIGIGLSVGGIVKNENQGSVVSNIIGFPLMFLSGIWVQRYLMPDWLQSITEYVPLTPFIDGLRAVVAEGATIVDIGPQLALLIGWTIIVYIIGFKFFRWE